jgi:hypothetical protein
MRTIVICVFLSVGLSACEQPTPLEMSNIEPEKTSVSGPHVPRSKPANPPVLNQVVSKQAKAAKPVEQKKIQKPELKAPSSLPDPKLKITEPFDDALPGTAVTAEEAVRRTIQALAWNDQLELALVAPSLNLSDGPDRIAPGIRIIQSDHFTAKRTEDWNGLSLQPRVQVGDILIRTRESWSETDPQKFAYLVRQSETGWAVLSRAIFRDSLS